MTTIDDLNYRRDARTRPAAEVPVLYELDGSETELPWKWEVCPVCEGKGTHVNPSIDAGGLDMEQMDDMEFMEEYLSGTYDVKCSRCGGRTTIPVCNYEKMTPDQIVRWEKQVEDEERAIHQAIYEY